MEKKRRRFWPGKLHPGDTVYFKQVHFVVASDDDFIDLAKNPMLVPAGHVPLRPKTEGDTQLRDIINVPLDDIDLR